MRERHGARSVTVAAANAPNAPGRNPVSSRRARSTAQFQPVARSGMSRVLSDYHHDELDRDGSDGGRSSAQAPFREADEDHEHQERGDVARRLQGIHGPGDWCPPSPVLEGRHSVGDAVQ